jgi:hypothetical protein
MKRYLNHFMRAFSFFSVMVMLPLVLNADTLEEKVSKAGSDIIREIPGTTATEGGISVLDLDSSTLKLKPIGGYEAIDISFKNASVSKDGQSVDKSSLKVGQIVRIHHSGEGEEQIAKAIEILPPANK